MYLNSLMLWAHAHLLLLVGILAACAVPVVWGFFSLRVRAVRPLFTVAGVAALVLVVMGAGAGPLVRSSAGSYTLASGPARANLYITEDAFPPPVAHYSMQCLGYGTCLIGETGWLEFHFDRHSRLLTAHWSDKDRVRWEAVALVTSSQGVSQFMPIRPGQTSLRLRLPAGLTPFSVTVAACSPKLVPINASGLPGTCS